MLHSSVLRPTDGTVLGGQKGLEGWPFEDSSPCQAEREGWRQPAGHEQELGYEEETLPPREFREGGGQGGLGQHRRISWGKHLRPRETDGAWAGCEVWEGPWAGEIGAMDICELTGFPANWLTLFVSSEHPDLNVSFWKLWNGFWDSIL